MGWLGSAPAPDPGIGEAAKASAELGKETFDFYKSIYETDLKPMQQRQLQLAEQATQSYLEDAKLARETARSRLEEDKANKDLRDRVKSDAMGYDSQANIDRRMGIAAASSNQQFSNARDQSLRSLSRYGVNPNSTAFARTNERLTRDQALATAGMQTGAAFDTMDKAIALRAGVNEAASGRSNTAGQFLGIAGASTGGAVGAGSGAMADARANAGMVGQGAGYGLQGYGQSGNLYGQEFQGRMQGYNAQMQAISGIGQGVGMAAGMAFKSARDSKEDMRPVAEGRALDAIENLDVEAWRYKSGQGDGGRHIGPYAEDFKRETGLGDGRSISVQDAIGLTMKAVQDLAQEVRGLRGPVSMAGGGRVRGPGGPVDDMVPAMLSNGEYVVPADVVEAKGVEFFDKLKAKYHTPAAQQRMGIRRS